MNRRSLFKFLGIGAATAAVAPKMLAEDHYPGMSGTPIYIKPYQPKPSICGNVYPTYADYTSSFTDDLGDKSLMEPQAAAVQKRYEDMMEQLVLTIDRELKRGAA